MPETPEQSARREIDADLTAAGWLVQSHDDLDLTAGRGIAVREFQMRPGFGFADYLLHLDRKAIGAIEAKPEGTLTGVEAQSAKYAAGARGQAGCALRFLGGHPRPAPRTRSSLKPATLHIRARRRSTTRRRCGLYALETLGETRSRGRPAKVPRAGSFCWKLIGRFAARDWPTSSASTGSATA